MFDGLLLSGTSEVSLDSKGRLSVPARYREIFADDGDGQCIVTRSLFDKCLWLYPSSEWDNVVSTLGSLPTMTDPLCRTIQRIVLGSAVFCQLDAQGRILLPPELRQVSRSLRKLILSVLTTNLSFGLKITLLFSVRLMTNYYSRQQKILHHTACLLI